MSPPFFNGQEQVLFEWWIILSTAVTLTWWCAGTSGSDATVLLVDLSTVLRQRSAVGVEDFALQDI